MPEYLSPGVYVEEVPSGSRPIEGVSTSTAGFVGMTQRGPVGDPTLVTSYADFVRRFGGYLDHRRYTHGRDALPYAVDGFFANGGSRLFISRIVGPGAAHAAVDVFGLARTNPVTTSLATSAAAGATSLTIDNGTNIAVSDTLFISDGTRTERVTASGAAADVGIRLFSGLAADVTSGTDVIVQEVTEGIELDIAASMAAGASELAIADASALGVNDLVLIRDTRDDSLSEIVTIEAEDEAGILGELQFSHLANRTTAHVVTLAAGNTTQLSNNEDAGATLLALDDPTIDGLASGAVVDIDGTRYMVAAVYATVDITALANAHGAGVGVFKVVEVMTVYGRYEGAWANTLRVRAEESAVLETTLAADAAGGDTLITLASTLGLGAGSLLDIDAGRYVVDAVDINTNEVTLTGGLDNPATAGTPAVSVEFDLIVQYLEDGVVENEEVLPFLSLNPDSQYFVEDIVGAFDEDSGDPSPMGDSDLVRIALHDAPNQAANDEITATRPVMGVNFMLQGGNDDLVGVDELAYIGQAAIDPADRTGIQSLSLIDDISIIAAPGQSAQDVQNALIVHAEQMRYRFVVLDSTDGATLRDVQQQRSLYDTTRAAFYYPWFVIRDPFGRSDQTINIPPSGHVAGIYARTDNNRGVHKAPANEVVLGIRRLAVNLNRSEQDLLNPRHINCVRTFDNRGTRVWGARTLSSDPAWRYINVRRLFLFVEKSIERGTQWAVFEPNDETLWATVRRSVTGFLTTVWRSGALEGTTAEEAFFVKADRSTMTQDDIDNGRLIVLVGIAPVKPAEFVIFRISQKTREANQ
jgi:hypothetical protein